MKTHDRFGGSGFPRSIGIYENLPAFRGCDFLLGESEPEGEKYAQHTIINSATKCVFYFEDTMVHVIEYDIFASFCLCGKCNDLTFSRWSNSGVNHSTRKLKLKYQHHSLRLKKAQILHNLCPDAPVQSKQIFGTEPSFTLKQHLDDPGGKPNAFAVPLVFVLLFYLADNTDKVVIIA